MGNSTGRRSRVDYSGNLLDDEWKIPVGDPGVIIEEICCTFEYDVAIDVVGAIEGTTDVIDEVCSGYVTLVRGEEDAF